MDDEQREQLERVKSKIGRVIVEFFYDHAKFGTSGEFHMVDLLAHINRRIDGIAPGSPDRIMRDLRQRRLINYEVVSRRQSLYRVIA